MTADWPTLSVRDLVDSGVIERPIDGNHGETHPKGSDFVVGGIPFIMASDLVEGRVDTKDCAFITEAQAKSLRKGFARSGDVLISHKATMGRTALVGEISTPFLMLTPQVTYYRVIDVSRLDPRFLKYYFDSPKFQLLFKTWGQKGSTRDYLGITAQLDLPIVVPPIDKQLAISHALGTLDDKIALNRNMSESLNAMARALFKSWFVDFGPVRAKADRRDTGLARHLAALFPNTFTDSEIGEIPSGWKVLGLDQIAQFLNGVAMQKFPPLDERTLPVIKIAQLRSKTTIGADLARASLDKKYIVRDGDMLFSWSGSLECVLWTGGEGALNQHLFKVTSSAYQKWFYYLATLEHLEEFRDIAAGKATTMGHIQRHHLSEAKVAVAPGPLLQRLDGVMAPLIERAVLNGVESRTIAALRDRLLPRLLSGDFRFKDTRVSGNGSPRR
jgi:type I restriction enzyme S subunit